MVYGVVSSHSKSLPLDPWLPTSNCWRYCNSYTFIEGFVYSRLSLKSFLSLVINYSGCKDTKKMVNDRYPPLKYVNHREINICHAKRV